MNSKQFVISVMSKDRPGIIADIATVIYHNNGDLADLNQSVLGGYFTMMLIAEFEQTVTEEILKEAFAKIESDTVLEAIIKEAVVDFEDADKALPGETYVVTAQGKNRKGLVKVLGDFFYGNRINVLDLVTVKRDEIYTMIFQVDLTPIVSMRELRDELADLAKNENLEVVLQHNDIYMATNEVGTAYGFNQKK